MKAFTVHTPPDLSGDEAAERARFVKDGFCWPALFVPLLWLLWHRLWVVLILYLIAGGVIAALAMPLGETASGLFGLLFALWFAFEANNLRRWSLDRRDWSEIGTSHGRGRAEAEARFFASRARREAVAMSPPPAAGSLPTIPAGSAARPRSGGEPVLGLFPEAGR